MSKLPGKSVLLLLAFFMFPVFAQAQAASQAELSLLNLEAYPRITAYLDLRDAQGNFISGLQAQNLTISENDQTLPAVELNQLRPGGQFVVAISPGTSFAIRDEGGLTRYDHVSAALRGWIETHNPQDTDDLSLVTTEGTQVSHLASPTNWLEALDAFQPELETALPNLNPLSLAIDLASDVTPRVGMGQAVLFITPAPTADNDDTLQNLADRASMAGVQVHVWLVDSSAFFNNIGANALRDLAAQTGGQFFAFSGTETLPEVGAYLEPLRNVYQLAYDSTITTSGEHQVSVAVSGEGWQITSNALSFNLDILPPNPIFISPPQNIIRTLPDEVDNTATFFLPTQQTLDILIEFPDGFERELVRSALYVDDALVAVNTAPPFDSFTWFLEAYTEDGRHVLRVEVEDILGLTGVTIDTPVQITIQRPPQGLWVTLSKYGSVLAVSAVALAGGVLLLVMVLAGRIGPRSMAASTRKAFKDPVTQPVTPKLEPPTSPHPRRRLATLTSRLRRSPRQTTTQPLAYLARLSEADQPLSITAIPITSPEVIFGCDPSLATIILDHPSIDALHARLRQGKEPDDFTLSDNESVAGTWVNYAPVSTEGARLEQGDIIHIGRVGFRFTLRKPTRPRTPVIIVEEAQE